MAEEKKLGPSVTYTNPDKGAKMITVAGVLMKEGQAVNLEEKLGKERAAPLLKKLANNRYFSVQGGPDHKDDQDQPAGPDDDQAAWAVNEEAKIRARDGDEAADKFVESLDDQGNVKDDQGAAQKQAEAKYKGPEEPRLEQPIPKPRRPQSE
jgi:hypothetical protein